MARITPALLLFCMAGAVAAQQPVVGTVTDGVTGEPIAGVRVEIVGTGAAASTAATGAFTLAAHEGGFTLAASHPAYRIYRERLATPPTAPLEIRLTPAVSFTDLVEVTAARARESADPATISNITAERVQEAYWGQDPAMVLAGAAPGFYAYNDSGNGIGYSYFTIRGFGQARSRVTLNGAPLNDAESGELFFIDLADFLATAGDIQVQRGVFGLSGIGGAIDITTATGSVEPGVSVHAGLGSYGTERYTVRYQSGLIDGTWQLAARYSKVETDGYRDQSWVEMWNVYISLARYFERSALRLVLFGGPEETHLAYLGVPHSVLEGGITGDADRDRRFNPLTYPGEVDTFTQPHVQLLHDMELAPETQLSQVLYYFRGDGHYEQLKENRWLFEYGLPEVVLPDGSTVSRTDLVRRRTVDEWDAGWVPKVTRTTADWTLTASGEARLHDAHHVGEVRWAEYYPDGIDPNHRYYDYRVEKRTLALLATASWRASERLSVTAGLQGTHHRYEMLDDKIEDVSFAKSFTFALPRLGAIVSLGEGAEAYVNIARGMKEPAFRTIYDPQDYYGTRAALDPEDVWDLEVGAAVRRDRWRARANLFYMKFSNEIVYAGALDDSGVPIYGNGARSIHRGVELEASASPSPRLGVDASLTLSRNTFTAYSEQWAPGVEVVYDGNRIAGYPDVLANLTLRGSLAPLSWTLAARHAGRFFLDNSEDNRRTPAERAEPGYVPLVNEAYTVVDAALRLPLPARWTRPTGLEHVVLELRLNNLLDATYTAFGYVDGGPQLIAAAGRNFYWGVTIGW